MIEAGLYILALKNYGEHLDKARREIQKSLEGKDLNLHYAVYDNLLGQKEEKSHYELLQPLVDLEGKINEDIEFLQETIKNG